MDCVDHGVCRLSIIPVRVEPSDRSEMVSQLLFGEHYQVTEVSPDEKWLKIRNAFDQYEGWIDEKLHYPITPEYFEQINNSEYKISTDLTSRILFKKEVLHVVIGSVLPLLNNSLFEVQEQLAFNGEAKSLYNKLGVESLLEIAKKYLNAPYLWGGKTPFGIDCSGFVQQVFKIAGYHLRRDARQQVLQGKEVSLEASKPGDLAFFTNKEGNINHVGILMDDNKIIHASGRVKIDSIDPQGIICAERKVYTHSYFKTKRVLRED